MSRLYEYQILSEMFVDFTLVIILIFYLHAEFSNGLLINVNCKVLFKITKQTYLVYKAVVLLGPWTIRFVNAPANVTAPWPLDNETLSICMGSNGRVPISGIPNPEYFKIS